MATERVTTQRVEQKLVDFFNGEGAQLGTEGDDAMRTPVEQALHSMRELLKMRREVSKARERGKMRAAVPETCARGHLFYREAHTDTECPYCLKLTAHTLRSKIESARGTAGLLWEQLKL